MSGSTFGTLFRVTTWGESHGPGVGVVIDGCPAGIPLSEQDIQQFLDRRKPGQSKYTTKRNESDSVEILSGVFEGTTTGTPISLLVRNQDQRSRDYGNIATSYRPGHADYCFDQKVMVSVINRGGGTFFRPRDDWPCCCRCNCFKITWRIRNLADNLCKIHWSCHCG